MRRDLDILALTHLAARLHAVSPADFERVYRHVLDLVENLEALQRLDDVIGLPRRDGDDTPPRGRGS
jgi:hypothetical protein